MVDRDDASTQGGGGLRRERHGTIDVWTIDRPTAANTLDRRVLTDLASAMAAVAADPAVRAVVLTGAGDRAFCGGMDLKAFERGELDGFDFADLFRFFRGGLAIPVVAAVNGAAVGGGFELVLGCDLVVASDNARFGLPEVTHGLVGASGAVELPTRIPLAIALELGLTGAFIDASRALALGLVNRVVPAGAALAAALDLAGTIVANAPDAVAATKHLMRAAFGDGVLSARVEADEVGARAH
ncbi:MAG: Enoyl-CoA hydratase/isomerase, partial [Acidimicrobiales bacterium]|nr:Enoyl-CoA hydratase/isomerase [Acidimicrobiales bacterium]